MRARPEVRPKVGAATMLNHRYQKVLVITLWFSLDLDQ